MTDIRHPDPVAPKEKDPVLANTLLIAGGLGIVATLAYAAAAEPIPALLLSCLLFLAGLTFIVGIIAKATEKVSAQSRDHVQELIRQQQDTVAPFAAIAATVEHNTWAINQLTSGRTVDMHNLHAAEERMEGLVRSLTGEAIGELVKEIRAQGEMLERRAEAGVARYTELVDQVAGLSGRFDLVVEDIKVIRQAIAAAYVDSLGDHPPALRALPPPRGRWIQDPS